MTQDFRGALGFVIGGVVGTETQMQVRRETA
jgi:hypothetical protein